MQYHEASRWDERSSVTSFWGSVSDVDECLFNEDISLYSQSFSNISNLSLLDEEEYARKSHDRQGDNSDDEEDDFSSISPSELSELLRTSSEDEDFESDDDDVFTTVTDLSDLDSDSSELSLSDEDISGDVEGVYAGQYYSNSIVIDIVDMLINEAVCGLVQNS